MAWGYSGTHTPKTKTMKKSYIFLADGFEEIEAISAVDILRRAGMDITTVSINDNPLVTGAHGIAIAADAAYTQATGLNDADWLILPGGMPGASNLAEFDPLCSLLKAHAADGGNVAAICAAPAVVLAPLGLLKGKTATCYPGFEKVCVDGGAKMQDAPVVRDGNIITANGPASAMAFALAIAQAAFGEEKAREIGTGLLHYAKRTDYYF